LNTITQHAFLSRAENIEVNSGHAISLDLAFSALNHEVDSHLTVVFSFPIQFVIKTIGPVTIKMSIQDYHATNWAKAEVAQGLRLSPDIVRLYLDNGTEHGTFTITPSYHNYKYFLFTSSLEMRFPNKKSKVCGFPETPNCIR
jgi:hypothetical protein